MEWHHKGFPPSEKVKTQRSAGKIMLSVFWASEGVIHFNFLPTYATVNAQYYSNLLLSGVHIAVREKGPGKL
jgi:hypothetical protein